MPDVTYNAQANLKFGGGRPPEMLVNMPGEDDDTVLGRIVTYGEQYANAFLAVEQAWLEQRPVPAAAPAAAPSHAQAVQNAQQGLGAVPAPPNNGRPGDGDIHPTKTCPDCANSGEQVFYKVVDKAKKTGGRFRKLECQVYPKEHKADWTENYK